MAGTATILRANARTLPLADASVDLIVTSPPYFALRSYTDGGEHYAGQIGSEPTPAEYIASLIECTREWMRVLKPSGSIWVNLGDSYYSGKGAPGRTTVDGKSEARTARRGVGNALDGPSFGVGRKSLVLLPERYRIACVDQLGLIARAVVIWSKPNGLPESVTDRVRRSHEDWVHLTKAPKYFSAVDAIREEFAEPNGRPAYGRKRMAIPGGNRGVNTEKLAHSESRDMGQNVLGKLPGSVWSIASQPLKVPAELGIDHFAAFPMEWPRRIILGWAPEGGTVLDPFGGTGTTALVAKALGRNGISVDMSADYCRLAKWRTTDPAQFARAQRPANPPRSVTLAEPVLDFDASLNEGGDMAADKEIMKAIERLRLDRPGRMHRSHRDGAKDLGLAELATTFREEAELWAKSGAKGWKGNEAEAYLISQAIDGVAAQLDNAGGGAALSISEPATTIERLDDFVNSAVAGGKGTLRPPIADRIDQVIADGGELRRDASGTVTPAMSIGGRGEDVTAYLRGDVDTLPGLAGNLVPSSVTSAQAVHAEPIIDLGPVTMPNTWESDTLTTDGFVKPGVAATLAPTLGQPGDMGTGYSHDFIPAGGRAVTYAELLAPVPAASLPPHLSHSQIGAVGDCGVKYRLQHVELLPQIPQWANIGGTAFHAAVEAFELTVAKMGNRTVDDKPMSWESYDVETVWKHHFEQTIADVVMTTTVPISMWRASRKGAEGEQWWRVNGPLMLRRHLDARPDETSMTSDGTTPMIEFDTTIQVPTPYGPIPFNAKIDRVTVVPGTESFMIRDYKTAYERPTDTTQLGDYAWVLAFAFPDLMAAGVKIFGSYFDARRGEWTTSVDLLATHPFEAFQYRVTAAHAQKRALTTGPTPARPSSYCGGCAVRYACPVMAARS